MNEFVSGNYIEILSLFPSIALLVGVFITVWLDPYLQRRHKRTMLVISVLVFSLIAQNYGDYLLTLKYPMVTLRTVVATYGYCIRPLILLLFLYIVEPSSKHRVEWALVGVNAAIYFISVFTHICFVISVNNIYHVGKTPFQYTCMIVSLCLLANLLYYTLRNYGGINRKEARLPIFVVLLILMSIVLDENVGLTPQPVSLLTIAIIIACALYYIWLHIQFVRRHEQELVAGQRVQLMLSQIKPHFLYNSLGAIEELCDSNPPAAKAATTIFSQYLRGNMDSITTETMIPFARELEHTRLYLKLEQLRFEDALQVRYDVAFTDFDIPPLTLEPLVENAVRHGVRKKETGRGTVTVATRAYGDRIEVFVTDDGPGFDPQFPATDGESHVGIQNVRDRLSHMCGGTLRVESTLGVGTMATIVLPRNGEEPSC